MKEDKLLKITLDDLIRYAAPEAVKLIEQEYEKDPEFKLKLSSKLVTKKPGMRPKAI